jgi:hypothetical protein
MKRPNPKNSIFGESEDCIVEIVIHKSNRSQIAGGCLLCLDPFAESPCGVWGEGDVDAEL